MERMKEHSPTIVSQVSRRCFCISIFLTNEQALIVSRELIRVAILWHELWHEGLEEASRLYFTEKNPDGMIAALEPLHDLLEAVSVAFDSSLNTINSCVTPLGSANCARDLICPGIWS